MNSTDSKNNFLFICNDEEKIKTFYERCLNYTKSGNIVLLLTGTTQELLPVLMESKLSQHELKRFVVITLDNIDACLQKLCEQHDWGWLPALIIADLRTILAKAASQHLKTALRSEDPNTTAATIKPLNYFQQLASCIAHLFGYQASVLKRLERTAVLNGSNPKPVYSILVLDEKTTNLSHAQIELIVNLYFYKDNAFDDLDEIFENTTL